LRASSSACRATWTAARGRALNPPAPSPGTSPNTPDFAGIAITFWDERLSTVAAEKALLEADTTRKRRAEVIDAVAAGYILQGALDRLRHIEASR
jgi:RNase H-fold protein (predicted Holliday junction resolvase)